MDKLELEKIVSKHGKWVRGEAGGEQADLSGANLSYGRLCGADLRDADLSGADLRDADLSGANLSYGRLYGASLSSADLRNADLRNADLRNADLRGANLRNADLRNADLRNANLRNADFRNTNLSGANLSGADLRNADLRSADLSGADLRNADLPESIKVENLFTKIKAAIENGGELEMNNWHGCKTTHCLAGWATSLAGEDGRVAENLVGTSWAAALIINESCLYLKSKVPDFYGSNEEAMNFINDCAEKENALNAENLKKEKQNG